MTKLQQRSDKIKCRECGAEPGQPCVNLDGNPVTWRHKQRVIDAFAPH